MTDDERQPPPVRPDVPGHRVDAVLGTGASAVVWSGVDPTGRRVAIKVPHLVRDDVDRRQSLAEQQVLLAVEHDHLVRLRSVVPLDDGREALVFDLVHGVPLAGMVRSRGHLRPGEVVTVLTPVCEAVAHLHAAGGLHADISPSNVTVTPRGRPVLLDLGAVRVPGREPGVVHGTPGFVAPEVSLGSRPDEASDVYALGAVAWFCLTGNGAPDTMTRLDLETVESHVGVELAEVVHAAIDPDPERRPGAAELARRFYEATAPEAVEVVVGADDASALTHRLRADAGPPPPAPTRAPRWPRRAAVAALVAVPLLAAAGWALAARGPASPPVTARTQAPAQAPAPESARTVSPPPAPAATRAAPRAPTRAPVPSAARPAAEVPLLLDAASPSSRPEDLLQALSDRRPAALVARDASALAAVHAGGSPSLASDRELVRALVAARTRWQGLRLQVAEAAYVTGSGRGAVVRARVDWTAYVVVTGADAPVTRPADSGRRLDFRLARGEQGWRIAAISVAPAT